MTSSLIESIPTCSNKSSYTRSRRRGGGGGGVGHLRGRPPPRHRSPPHGRALLRRVRRDNCGCIPETDRRVCRRALLCRAPRDIVGCFPGVGRRACRGIVQRRGQPTRGCRLFRTPLPQGSFEKLPLLCYPGSFVFLLRCFRLLLLPGFFRCRQTTSTSLV